MIYVRVVDVGEQKKGETRFKLNLGLEKSLEK